MTRSEKFWGSVDCFLLVVGALVLTPLLTSRSTLDPALTPQFLAWAVASFLLCLSLSAQILAEPAAVDSGILRHAVFPAFLGYLLFSVISLSRAANVGEGVYEVLKIATSTIFFLLATHTLARTKGSRAFATKAVVITAIVVSLMGLHQFFEYAAIDRPGRSLLTGTMGHKNLFASGLFLMLPFCLYAALVSPGLWGILGAISTASILPLIVLSRTRAIWLALVVSAAVTTMVALLVLKRVRPVIPPQAGRRALRRMACGTLLCLLIGGLLVILYVQSHSLKGVVPTAMSTESLSQRMSVWRKTLEMIHDNAWWGVGAGNWKIVFPSYGLLGNFPADWLKTVVFVRPHNDLLWVLSEIGGIGFLFYVATFGITLGYTFRVVMQRSWTNETLLSFLMLFGVVGYLVIASFSFSRERVFDTILLLLMMAIVTSLYHQHFPTRPIRLRPLMLSILLISVLLLSAAVGVGYLRLNAEIHTKKAFAARMAQDWPAVLREIDAAYSPFATLDPMATPLKWYRGEANFASNNLSQAIADYEQAVAAHPYHVHVLNNLATCYVLTNRPADAIGYYEKAIRIFPRFAEAACNLAAVYFNKGDYEKASSVLEGCRPDMPNATLERYQRIVAARLASDANSLSDSENKNNPRSYGELALPFGDKLKDVHRLWSSFYGRYFYTVDTDERDAFLGRRQQTWIDEGVAYRAFADSTVPGVAPVYRFYWPTQKSYFYVIESPEAQKLMHGPSDRWKYEGIAFYAFPAGQHPQGAAPTYRFWSPQLRYHLYTIDEKEVEQLKSLHSDTWVYEGVAWYAYRGTP